MSTYFLLDPFEFPYYFYRIRYITFAIDHQGKIYNKSDVTFVLAYFVIDPPLMMAQSRAETTWDTYNYGQYINQFPPNTIKVIR